MAKGLLDDDAFEAAAYRGRRSASGSRPRGAATGILENYLPHLARGLLSLPERATEAAGSLQRGGSYDPGPALEAALITMGVTPFSAPRGAIGAGPIRAYHGSPHDFERFDLSKVGSGEGAQMYGHGLYFAENPKVAQGYRERLAPGRGVEAKDIAARILESTGGDYPTAIAEARSRVASLEDRRVNAPHTVPKESMSGETDLHKALDLLEAGANVRGRSYEVNIRGEPEQFLEWDAPLPQDFRPPFSYQGFIPRTGADYYRAAVRVHGSPEAASAAMRDAGIPGIRYWDSGSRGLREGTSNYVVFDPATIDILRKYGLMGGAIGGGGILGGNQEE